ncbi:hypothetical protein B0I35DRAFT_446199 [Stachybotrys elegans]|uniref:Uncharacterized protein n=1 Tax=Stachybotrys elegans TaxID=80388 RepID=A0A8K0SC65_9HYPO|nr:hypothetical protein B0I35DRAFT_446199 [Stachybotrys elegans]
MRDFKRWPGSNDIIELCNEPQERNLLHSQNGLRRYEVTKTDRRIYLSFRLGDRTRDGITMENAIKAEALLEGKRILDEGPEICHIHEMDGPNAISFRDHTIAVFICLLSSQPTEPPKVVFQGNLGSDMQNAGNENGSEKDVPWTIGDFIVIPEKSALFVKKGVIRFGLLRYYWTPVEEARDETAQQDLEKGDK